MLLKRSLVLVCCITENVWYFNIKRVNKKNEKLKIMIYNITYNIVEYKSSEYFLAEF